MKATDLKKGSIIEIKFNFSPERMNEPTQVEIERVTKSYLWFKYSVLQRIGVNTLQKELDTNYYKIISL